MSIFVFADSSDIIDDIPNQLDNEKQIQVVEKSENITPGSDCEEKQEVDKEKKSYSDKLKKKRYELKKKYKKLEKKHQSFTKKFVQGFKEFIRKGKNLGK